MRIPEPVRANFNMMLRAAANEDLALVECTDPASGEPRYVICAIAREGDSYLMTPFGHLVSDQSPYDAYVPPV